MYSSEFAQYFSKIKFLKDNFLGTFSSDTVPKDFDLFRFAVINTADSSSPGVHWVAAIKTSENLIELFDSLGFKESFLSNFKHLPQHYNYIYNITPVQSPESHSCGQFVIFFLVSRLFDLDLTFSELLNEQFSPDLKQNEQFALSFCNDLLKD